MKEIKKCAKCDSTEIYSKVIAREIVCKNCGDTYEKEQLNLIKKQAAAMENLLNHLKKLE